MAATKQWLRASGLWRNMHRAWKAIAALRRSGARGKRASLCVHAVGALGSLLTASNAQAVDLPEDRTDVMYHSYKGGGLTASGPALLVRKRVADTLSLSGTYYVDMVSNASIDVVTTASPFKERRHEYGVGVDYAYQDVLVSLSSTRSTEPDYVASSTSLNVSQDVFGGMTTLSLGFTHGNDKVGKKNSPEFSDTADHWRYRLGATQILTPRWLMSANVEAVSDGGFLGSPYRVARVFGSFIQERAPRTRSSRSVKLSAVGDVSGDGPRSAVRAEYRYFWDTWDIRAHTAEIGYSRYIRDAWLADAYVRVYSQTHALFYSNNAAVETAYISRNRQLSTFKSVSLGTKLSYAVTNEPGKYDVKLNLSYELMRFRFSDFTDLRTGDLYKFDANVIQLFVSATF